MGKMVLLVVLGSFIIIGRYMMSNNDVANDAVANVIDYYARQMPNILRLAGLI